MKGDPAIDGVEPERVIPEAIDGNKEALRQLLVSVWLWELLDLVTGRVSRRFKVDADELWHLLFESIRNKVQTITNPENIPWADLLKRWCFKVGKNHARNLIRHRGVEERHCDSVSHANTVRLTEGKRTAPLHSSTISPEEAVLRKEQDTYEPAVRRATVKIYYSLTLRDAWLVFFWKHEMTLQEISDLTGVPLATVGNRVKFYQKAVVKEVMKAARQEERVVELLAAVNKHSEGIRELLASSLAETILRGDGLYVGARAN
jgi:DNA-directed RNA polymerase specialized sigma24 family protein